MTACRFGVSSRSHLSLCVFIIALVARFVKCFFYFFDFFGSSCRPLPFNPLVLLHLTPLQACMGFFASGRCWFTFIFRTTGLRAVEDFVRGVLRTLMGHTLTSSVSWALLPIPHFCLDYSTHFALCQDFFSPRGSPSSLSGGTVFHEPFQVLRGLTRTCVPASCGCPRSPLECLYYSTDFVLCQAFFFIFFWGSSLFVPLFIPPEGCSYFVNAESVLQRIFAIYNLAGVVSQSATKRGGLTQALPPRRLIKGFQLSRIPLFVI